VLGAQPLVDPLGGVPLLGRRGEVGLEDPVDDRGDGVEPGPGDGKDSCAILTQGPLYPGVTAVAEPATRRAAVRVAY